MWNKRHQDLADELSLSNRNKVSAAPEPGASLNEAGPLEDDGAAAAASNVSTPPPETAGSAQEAASDAAAVTTTEHLQQLLRKKLLSAKFGDIVALLSRSPSHRHYSLSDLEWLVIPPLLLNQYMLAEANLPTGESIPVGVVFFARVSAELDAALTKAPRYPVRLHPQEWRSGDKPWIIDVAGDPKIIASIIDTMAKTVFGGEPFKMLPVTNAQAIVAAQKTAVEPSPGAQA